MTPDHLLRLLGRNTTDPILEQALSHYAIRNRPEVRVDEEDADGPVVETQSWVKNSRAGIEFGFQDEAAWLGLNETEFGKRPMVLTEIYLYGRHDGVRPYQGELPFNLKLSDDRATVREKLIRFESTRHSYVRDTWDEPSYRLTVSYADGKSGIGFVVFMLREPALPALPYALAPVPSVATIVKLIGCTLDDPAIHQAFDTLGLMNQIEQIKDAAQADFLNPYGCTLAFAKSTGAGERDAPVLVLASATLYRERELGGRAWPGELPFGISFEDSPETLEKKMARPPDHRDDEDFSGRAAWREPTMTLDVLYSTMDNRIYRVSIVAPGLWATDEND